MARDRVDAQVAEVVWRLPREQRRGCAVDAFHCDRERAHLQVPVDVLVDALLRNKSPKHLTIVRLKLDIILENCKRRQINYDETICPTTSYKTWICFIVAVHDFERLECAHIYVM